jgi:uncharacterized protein YjbI with pentapeptide repeats
MLEFLKQKGTLSPCSTQDILQRIVAYVEANGSIIGLSFAGENLAGIDLSQKTIQEELNNQGYSEQNPPPWYSGDLKQAKLRKKPDIIASARDPEAAEVASKRAINLEGVDFSNAVLVCANFEGADLSLANFQDARLHYANFCWARLCDANFKGARLKKVDLTRAALQNADFTWAKLRGATINKCLLYHVHMENTEMERGQIKETWEERTAKKIEKGYLFTMNAKQLEEEEENLNRDVISEELRGEFKLNGFSLSENTIVIKKGGEWRIIDGKRRFAVRKEEEQLSVYGYKKDKRSPRRHYKDATIAYNRLKNNFISIGRHSDAGWAFIKEKKMERKTLRRISTGWIFNWLMDISCSYGEQPLKVLFIALVIVVGFSFAYWEFGGIESTCWSDNFIFSLRSFVTMAFSDISPVTLTAKILSSSPKFCKVKLHKHRYR